MIDQLNLFFFVCGKNPVNNCEWNIKKNTHTHMLSIADETNKCKSTKMSTIVFFLVGQKEIDKSSAFFALKTQNQIWKKNMHFRFTWFVCKFFVDLTSMDYMCEEISCIYVVCSELVWNFFFREKKEKNTTNIKLTIVFIGRVLP